MLCRFAAQHAELIVKWASWLFPPGWMGSGGRGNEPGGCGGRVGGCSRRTSQQYSWNVYTSLPPPVGKLCRDGGLRKRAPWIARPACHLMWLSSLSSAQDAGADTQKDSWGSTVKIELVTVTGSSIFIYSWFLEEHIFTVHVKIDFC